MWYVYLVRCSNDTLYCGVSVDVRRRVEQHNEGTGAKYTRAHRPVHLVWSQGPFEKAVAFRTEAKIKAMTKRQKEDLVAGELLKAGNGDRRAALGAGD